MNKRQRIKKAQVKKPVKKKVVVPIEPIEPIKPKEVIPKGVKGTEDK